MVESYLKGPDRPEALLDHRRSLCPTTDVAGRNRRQLRGGSDWQPPREIAEPVARGADARPGSAAGHYAFISQGRPIKVVGKTETSQGAAIPALSTRRTSRGNLHDISSIRLRRHCSGRIAAPAARWTGLGEIQFLSAANIDPEQGPGRRADRRRKRGSQARRARRSPPYGLSPAVRRVTVPCANF